MSFLIAPDPVLHIFLMSLSEQDVSKPKHLSLLEHV